MKRVAPLLLATAPLLLPATTALGQTTIALTGGTNLASLAIDRRGDHDSSARRMVGLGIGLDATVPISQRLGLQLGASFTEKGTSFRDRYLLDYRGSLELRYLEMRMLGKALVYDSGGGVELHLVAGPAVAGQTSCRWYGQVTVRERTTGHHSACEVEETSSFDFGVVGGGWMEMWVSDRFGLLLSLLQTHGLQDIEAGIDDVTMKTRTMSLHAGGIVSIG